MAYVINKSSLFQKVAYAPNPAQRRIHESRSRFMVVAAGRRTGKSTAGGYELLPEAFKAYMNRSQLDEAGQRAEFWIVGPQYTDSEKEFRTFYNAAKRLQMPFDKPGTYYDAKGGDMQVSLWGGKFLLKAQSAKYPEHLVGEGLRGVVMAEAAKMKQRIWTQYISPTLMDFRGWAKFNSTPEGKNWFHGLYMKGVGHEENWESVRAPSWFNTAIFPLGENDPEIQQWRRDMPPELFAQEVEAKFSEYVGRVFKEWDEDWHVRNYAYHPEWPLYAATDYGWTNPNVVLFIQVDPFDRVHVLSEYYQSHRTMEDIAKELHAGVQDPMHPVYARHARLLYPDPASPKDSADLAQRMQWSVRGNTGGEQKTRLNLIRKWLKDHNDHLPYDHEDRYPMLTVAGRCANGQREMDAYRYPQSRAEKETSESESPLDKDDHWPEALGRFMVGHFGAEAVGGAPRQRRMKVRR